MDIDTYSDSLSTRTHEHTHTRTYTRARRTEPLTVQIEFFTKYKDEDEPEPDYQRVMADQPAEPGTLFLGTRYHICPALPPSIQEGLESILSTNGGVRASGVEDPKLNVVITRSEKFEGWEVVVERNRNRRGRIGEGEGEEEEEIHVVTPIWADRSVMLGKRQL